MRTVSRFEAKLLQILRCVLGRVPLSQVLPAIAREAARPPCLGRDCVELIEQSLANGVVDMLARADGWQRERFLREDQIAEGRLWQRTPPEKLGMEFSPNSVDFLMWLTASDSRKSPWKPHQLPTPTTGDQLLFFLAFQALRNTDFAKPWCGQPTFHNNGLCALMFPDDFAEHGAEPAPCFDPWLSDRGSLVLEALQGRLAERWSEVERSKARITSVERMRSLGAVQEAVLASFLDAADRAGRRDLARFLLIAARAVLGTSPSAENWAAALKVDGLRLSERMAAYRAAFTLLRHVQRLGDWQKQARHVGYFDEGYAASQLWKSDWERLEGEALCQTSRGIIRELEPLGGAAATPDSAAE